MTFFHLIKSKPLSKLSLPKINTNHMTNQYPITPPPELVQEWVDMLGSRSDQDVFTLVAGWGSDRELQACCAQISQCHLLTINQSATIAKYLHSCRRPKPPSPQYQALAALEDSDIG